MPATHNHQSIRHKLHSTLAGQFQVLPKRGAYRATFVPMNHTDARIYRLWTKVVAYGAFSLVLLFGAILFNPNHWIIRLSPTSPTHDLNLVMLVCLFALQIMWVIGTYSATRATVKARTPVPVRPARTLSVAFVTTRAPGEPIDMVEHTLRAMKKVKYAGRVTVWLLDETNDSELQEICKRLRVEYFTRAGIAAWNTPKNDSKTTVRLAKFYLKIISFSLIRFPQPATFDQAYGAKTKHGNFNAWRAYLAENGLAYDILCGVDTDHVPLSNYLNRLLGYFRDPDVAYVVGPQVYGNYRGGWRGTVARWAESQASFFQSTIQRAGNTAGVPMFVGTNYAVRMTVLDQIGGFQPCITEDMATGLAVHTKKNPETKKRWKSIYTPDVLAIGEGPELWGSYFSQQWRWAAGTFDTWKRVAWKRLPWLSPRGLAHYFLILTFYPITALTWLLGIVSSLIYLTTGATALLAPWNQFVSLYLMTLVLQLSLYFWNRRFNVSPHEPAGSFGLPGIVITSIAAPIYLSALVGVLLNRKVNFVVTAKGQAPGRESWRVFRIHAQWAAILSLGIVYGWQHGHNHPAMLVWTVTQLLVCVMPMTIYAITRLSTITLKLAALPHKRRELKNA